MKKLKERNVNDYILSYTRVKEIIEEVSSESCVKKEWIGKTAFGYPIEKYEVGSGKKQVLLIGATHGCELITTYFVVEFLRAILKETKLLEEFTFHLIPILNPEGYIISSSNVISNIQGFSKIEFEKYATHYQKVYEECDKLAQKGHKITSGFYGIIKANVKNIQQICMEKSVEKILTCCHLSENVLPIWTANGLGIDQNSNSIHQFCQMKKLRKKQQCAALRYNIIPVTIPSPMSYPGEFTFDRSLENLALFRYIHKLYQNTELTHIFSYHATGGEIYGYPETKNQQKIEKYIKAMSKYANITGYEIIDEKLKYGVMDYYRKYLENTICLTIELSKLNANPIGPYSNIEKMQADIEKNKEAVIKTISDY